MRETYSTLKIETYILNFVSYCNQRHSHRTSFYSSLLSACVRSSQRSAPGGKIHTAPKSSQKKLEKQTSRDISAGSLQLCDWNNHTWQKHTCWIRLDIILEETAREQRRGRNGAKGPTVRNKTPDGCSKKQHPLHIGSSETFELA